MNGDHARAAAAARVARRSAARPGAISPSKALSEAIGAGQMDLALNLARDSRRRSCRPTPGCCSSAEEISAAHPERALPWLAASRSTGDLSFLAPLITAWAAAEHGDADQALAALDQVPAGSLLAPLARRGARASSC